MAGTTKILGMGIGIKNLDSQKRWRKENVGNSLPEVFSSIQVRGLYPTKIKIIIAHLKTYFRTKNNP
jgi:hypothetical protein